MRNKPVVNKREIDILNDISQISFMAAFIDEIVNDWLLSEKLRFELNLVLEELITNIIFYAYEDQEQHMIHLTFERKDQVIEICLQDDGKSFDPLADKGPDDLDKPAEEREIGGLGIHFVRQLTESIRYQRHDGKNILSLTMKIS